MANLSIWMIKETVEKLMAILSSKGWTYNILIFRHQFTYILNKRNGFLRSLFHTANRIHASHWAELSPVVFLMA